MIYVRLAGGLGNQLFQIAAALVADARGVTPIRPILGGLARYEVPRQPDALRIVTCLHFSHNSHVEEWLVDRARIGRWLPGIRLGDSAFCNGFALKRPRHLAVLDGYFQSGWTDAALTGALKRMQPKEPSEEARQRVDTDECAMHIRGGDFLRLSEYQVTGPAYYSAAIRLAKQAGFSRFAILTDDPQYGRLIYDQIGKEVKGITLRIVPPVDDPLIDFDTLRVAAARVIGNSTFAWWASALDDRRAPTWSPTHFTTAAPRDFFLPWEQLITSSLLPINPAAAQAARSGEAMP